MRTTISLLFLAAALSACSSESKTSSSGSASPSVNQDDSSQVLAPKKCPRHSKMVNGKCTLQVESDD